MASKDASVIRLKPLQYIHVLDNNSNVTRVEYGPKTFTRQEHEKIVLGPEEMIKIPPRHYVTIANPVVKDAKGVVVRDEFNNYKLRFGDQEIRFEQEPFYLHPGESLVGSITPLQVVAPNSALRLKALRDFVDGDASRTAGDEWLFRGPGTYLPRVEVQVSELITARIIKDNQAVRLRARKATKDFKGGVRKAGEEWLVREQGAYLTNVDEEFIGVVNAIVLTEKKGLHLRALRTFVDVFGKKRRAGEEWLITINDTEAHIPDVYEEVIGEIPITTLTNREYCVVLDPVGPNGKNQFGKRELRKGEASFFLRPGEKLEKGIQSVIVLAAEEALLFRAKEAFKDGDKVHAPGDRWMIHGPTDYVPPVEVEIVEKRKVIPLDENEGIYVRDITTGKIRTVCGVSYLLSANEELWEKELPPIVEQLLHKTGRDDPDAGVSSGAGSGAVRDKTRVVTYRAPHNSAVQIFDYKKKKGRVVYGPELVMLDPDEQFTLISLSGGKPKRPDVIQSIALFLGPDFMTDVVTVETADHARLSLQLAYNWNFEKPAGDASCLFSVPDFVGDACKAIASRVRGAVAGATFDNFHKNSAEIIREAVFGRDPDTNIRNKLFFSANCLAITNIDIQAVEPVDQRTKDSLQKSVQLAIEITTKSQEATARHEAQRIEQEAKGRLERQKIVDEADAEKSRTELLQLQAHSAAVEATGQAAAEAKAKAEANQIEGQAAVKQAQLKAEATKIVVTQQLEQQKAKQQAEIEHRRAMYELEVGKAKEMAAIEIKKFSESVNALGKNTIKAIATAGPEAQAKLLQGLGLKSFLITDGNSPINLFNTAAGLIGNPTAAAAGAASTAVVAAGAQAQSRVSNTDDF